MLLGFHFPLKYNNDDDLGFAQVHTFEEWAWRAWTLATNPKKKKKDSGSDRVGAQCH